MGLKGVTNTNGFFRLLFILMLLLLLLLREELTGHEDEDEDVEKGVVAVVEVRELSRVGVTCRDR